MKNLTKTIVGVAVATGTLWVYLAVACCSLPNWHNDRCVDCPNDTPINEGVNISYDSEAGFHTIYCNRNLAVDGQGCTQGTQTLYAHVIHGTAKCHQGAPTESHATGEDYGEWTYTIKLDNCGG
jgi:hypothetical protein